MRSLITLISLACIFSTSTYADSSQTNALLVGVWSGNIGKLAITVCFNKNFDHTVTRGNYYYHRHLIPIDLDHDESTVSAPSPSWKESSGTWQIDNASSDHVAGTWINPDKSRRLPIKLTRVGLSADDSASGLTPCGSSAYNRAIERSLKNIIGPTLSVGELKYRVLTLALPEGKNDAYKGREQYHEIIELVGDSPSVAAINKSIRKLAYVSSDNFLACRQSAMNLTAREGSRIQEMFVSTQGRWLTVRTRNNGNCGDRGVQLWESTYLWDISTGKQVSLFSWLKGSEVANDSGRTRTEGRLPDALDEILASRFGQGNHFGKEDLERCYGEYQPGAYTYRLELTNDGIDFILPFTSNGSCGDSFSLTFKELWPFLTSVGRRFSADIQAARKGEQ
jgi:hypothetical protein